MEGLLTQQPHNLPEIQKNGNVLLTNNQENNEMTHPLFICMISDPSRGADLEGKTKVFIKKQN